MGKGWRRGSLAETVASDTSSRPRSTETPSCELVDGIGGRSAGLLVSLDVDAVHHPRVAMAKPPSDRLQIAGRGVGKAGPSLPKPLQPDGGERRRLDRTKRRLVRAVPIVSEGSSTNRCSVLAVETDAILRNGQGKTPRVRTAGLIVHLAASAIRTACDALRDMVKREGNRHQCSSRSSTSLWPGCSGSRVRPAQRPLLDFSSRRRRKHCKKESNAATGSPTT